MSRYKVEINGYTIQEYEKLSHQETMNLLDQYHQTNDENIKEKLVLSNLKLVLSLVQNTIRESVI